jgi:hypothetical protein
LPFLLDTNDLQPNLKSILFGLLDEVRRLKEWIYVQVLHHKEIVEVIEEYQRNGWSLHTYSAAGTAGEVKHYLLFERGS